MILRLYLIRHGETEWSLSGQHTGRLDIPLTARGEDGALELALRLRSIPFAHVFSSPRQRARRTCELAGLGSAARVEPDLAEWDYGDTKDNLRGHPKGTAGLEHLPRWLSWWRDDGAGIRPG
jgi:broad specificity phosphatase PhoE